MKTIDLSDVRGLVEACRSGRLRPIDLVDLVLERLAASTRPEAWLSVFDHQHLVARAEQLESLPDRSSLPLYGVPFAVKDNIDVEGVPTTVGCPAYAYQPQRNASVVQCLLDAGAIAIGKTHMDQFATGLVGTRSPHGPCRNAVDERYISGGSSSGSAVVVAQGLVSFSLGTDTAGSGRVPASMNGIVGFKPSCGWLSLNGVVPACLSLDCVSLFAADADSAALVFDVLKAAPQDHFYCRQPQPRGWLGPRFRFGVPPASQLSEVTDEGLGLFEQAQEVLQRHGGEPVEIDYAPFVRASALLYGAAWIAERHAAVGDFIEAHPDEVDPVVAGLIRGSAKLTARQAFEGMHELRRLRAAADATFRQIDIMALPAVPRLWRIDEVLAEPLTTNATLGIHHSFMNLLDLSGCVVPMGKWEAGIPFGLTLCAPAWGDDLLLDLGRRLAGQVSEVTTPSQPGIRFMVVGAHLSGMPLNPDLVRSGGRFEAAVKTSADYRLYALRGTVPPKPGLCRVSEGGVSIEGEVWSLPADAFGRFVAAIPRPLGIGRATLEDGSEVSGFICEPQGIADAEDVSSFGGWRGYIASRK